MIDWYKSFLSNNRISSNCFRAIALDDGTFGEKQVSNLTLPNASTELDANFSGWKKGATYFFKSSTNGTNTWLSPTQGILIFNFSTYQIANRCLSTACAQPKFNCEHSPLLRSCRRTRSPRTSRHLHPRCWFVERSRVQSSSWSKNTKFRQQVRSVKKRIKNVEQR